MAIVSLLIGGLGLVVTKKQGLDSTPVRGLSLGRYQQYRTLRLDLSVYLVKHDVCQRMAALITESAKADLIGIPETGLLCGSFRK